MYACRSLNATRRLTIGDRETRVPRLIACHSLIELEDTQHKIWAQIHLVSQIAAQMMVVEVEESAEERDVKIVRVQYYGRFSHVSTSRFFTKSRR